MSDRGKWELTIFHTLSDGSGPAGPIVRYVSPEGLTYLARVSHELIADACGLAEVIIENMAPDASDETKAAMAADLREAIAAWWETGGER